mmetsp:Transcript_20066/g.69643  ORF Transcript_20066/g.69643 Transcript_20066/m.69643 type:complete len:214 (-) Transcript_20066:49-690(-)
MAAPKCLGRWPACGPVGALSLPCLDRIELHSLQEWLETHWASKVAVHGIVLGIGCTDLPDESRYIAMLGAKVRICGLSASPELNGQLGTVVKLIDFSRGRYGVAVDGQAGAPKLMRPRNLELVVSPEIVAEEHWRTCMVVFGAEADPCSAGTITYPLLEFVEHRAFYERNKVVPRAGSMAFNPRAGSSCFVEMKHPMQTLLREDVCPEEQHRS